ncbi:hypothetical protein CSV71_15360 [Sporosarcina sp. P21c]|uniref:hypothetical protein n=1 Tax=Sporosarcina TaxID=1569 RepID=UPI000A16C5D7|nr:MULTISPECIES: hypothetical protein [Sporosarcina]ARJ37639.1 hypothetical protein SporoP8_01315 [Sporosarcina ureae]PIC66021.1 hypothetical protein CSV78_14825 [Sporosarcina sp. P16a]PIC88361.1 hypothetical protein CSV71_15360 [Sporosarcina sp. P21c]PIC91511.1 hypothetical protein CSV70_15390 [Sporosarcina sp. P25]
MKRRHTFLIVLLVLHITVLLAYDFFSNFNELFYIPKLLFIGLILLILLGGFFENRYLKNESLKYGYLFQIALTSYLLTVLIVFTLLGGVSQVGISLSSPVVWILLIITFYDIRKEYKEYKDLQISETNIKNS